MKNILITGISGFVGTNLATYLHHHTDWKIFGTSRRKLNLVSNREEIIQIGMNHSEWNEHQVDVVVHLAGIAHDLSGTFKPDDYETVNAGGTQQAVDEFLKSHASVFIFVSSIKAVVDYSEQIVDEDFIACPTTDYGKSKLKAEQYIQSKTGTGKYFYILRPAMIHGPGNKGNLNLLYRFVKWRLPFPLGQLKNERSFLSIENFCFVVQALITKNYLPGIYHVSDDGYLSTTELYELMAQTTNRKKIILNCPIPFIVFMATLLGKKHWLNKLTESMKVSNRKIGKMLGEELPVSLRDGLQHTIQSFDAD
ncbi:MAG: NAD-dependent epimerase/dehydratase family protein [Bacteroidetes bacterium]|nr:NAD-dependent epimerase/dehydratase family protein [Bacteroidota bacterium]